MVAIRLSLLILGIIMVLGMLFDRPLYALSVSLYRKWGWSAFADTWEERRKWLLPVNRIVLAVICISTYVALYIL